MFQRWDDYFAKLAVLTNDEHFRKLMRFSTHAEVIEQDFGDENVTAEVKVEKLVIYPVKSCGGFSANVWPLSNSGKQVAYIFMFLYMILLAK